MPQADSNHVDVSIVMPCLNEVATLPACIAEAQEALSTLSERHGLTGEVVIADNGSTDGSWTEAQRLGARVVMVMHKGYGNALIGGITAAHGRFIVMADADCSYDFREAVPLVEKLMAGNDLCMGSRLKGTIQPGAMPWKNRYIGNPALTGVLNLLFRSGLSDAHCGLRAFTRAAFERMRLSSSGMEFASEMVIKATLLGLARDEVPVTLRPDKRGRAPHLRPWRDGWRHLRYLFMLSPAWLFFVPSAAFGLLGLLIVTALVLQPNLEIVAFGTLGLGNHSMVVAGALLVLSHQAMIFGIATTLYGVLQGYRRTGLITMLLLRLSRLEFMLLTGLALAGLGVGLFGYVLVVWSGGGFGALSMLRQTITAMMFIMLGAQTIFGGFLLSIVGGNQTKFDTAVAQVQSGPSEPETFEARPSASGS